MNDAAANLEGALQRLRRVAGSPANAAAGRANALVDGIVATVIDRVDALGDPADPPALPPLERHWRELVDEYLRLLDGGAPTAPVFVEHYARAAAERHFPLESLLQAYRVGLQYLLGAATDGLRADPPPDAVGALTAITDFLLEFIDGISAAAAEYYLDQARLLAAAASDQRSELLTLLLGGYEQSDQRVTAMLRDAGYLDRRLKFCVVLAQSIDPTEMHRPARARRLGDHIDRMLAHIPGERLIDTHRNKTAIVFSHRQRLSGWSPPRASLAGRIADELLKIGPAARIGVSNEVDSTTEIPAAYRQALLAFDAASIGRRVVRFADIPLQSLLLQLAGEEFTRALPHWASALRAADRRARGRLSATLRAYADNDLNLLRASRELGVHANTVYARFDRIAALTGRDPRRFAALNDLLIVIAADSPAGRG